MPDTQTQATALAGLAGIGAVAFVVGSIALATQYGGVWAGLTVGGITVTTVGAIGLFAVGTVDKQTREQTGRVK